MSKNNLISTSFTAEELSTLDNALNQIREVLKGKMVNLSPEERTQYGAIAEQNKLFVDKAKNYMEKYPEFVPPFVDKAEFDKDYALRKVLEDRLIMLTGITEQVSDTKKLADNDNYQNALTFYRNIKFLSKEDVPGTTNIMQDLSQFFNRTGAKKDEKTE